MLVRLVYASEAAVSFDGTALRRLLDGARTANAAAGVTGMLLFSDGAFFQVLEGEEAVVRALFAKISTDPRHRRIVKIVEEAIASRDFAHWSMGYTGATRAELARIDGLNDFFSTGRSFVELRPGRARKLLESFREGRWRQRAAS